MNLVNELQSSAESDDVLTVLRRTKRLATKLNRVDIEKWLNCELNGYGEEDDLPAYRRISVTFAMKTNGYIPVGYGKAMNGILDLPIQIDGNIFPIPVSIDTILSYFDGANKGQGIYLPIEQGTLTWQTCEECVHVAPEYQNQLLFLIKFNTIQLKTIPDRIKNIVLDWALELEKVGVTGEGMSFSTKDKQIAQNVIFNITNSTIEQLSNSGTNKKER